MKLVDILARELKEWPSGCEVITQDADRSVFFWKKPVVKYSCGEWLSDDGESLCDEDWAMGKDPTLAHDYATAIVTRAQWQAAVEALKSPSLHCQELGRITRQQPAIDWSKAPEDCVGCLVELRGEGRIFPSEVEQNNAKTIQFRGKEFAGECLTGEWKFYPRPAVMPWNGSGLPPVGTECEFKSVGHHEGPEFKWCIFHGKTKFGGYIIEHYQRPDAPISTADAFDPALTYFRQIRGPEQIASEEREKAIEELAAELGGHWCEEAIAPQRAMAGYLYDKGYRKQVQP